MEKSKLCRSKNIPTRQRWKWKSAGQKEGGPSLFPWVQLVHGLQFFEAVFGVDLSGIEAAVA